MIEDELEAKLTNALSSYIDRTASHQVWSSGVYSKPTFWVFFPNHIFKGAICAAKSKYEDEWKICGAAEVAQDKAESRACQTEESLKASRDECDAVHKSLTFWEAEKDELQIELDIERERNWQELRVERDGSGEQRGSGVHQTGWDCHTTI